MSKKSQREAREREEQKHQDAQLKFLAALEEWLKRLSVLPRRAAIDEDEVGTYAIALRHLSPKELTIACTEALRSQTFFPVPAEIIECLKTWRGRHPVGNFDEPEPASEMTDEEKMEMKKLWDDAWKKIGQIGKKGQMVAVGAQRQPGDE